MLSMAAIIMFLLRIMSCQVGVLDAFGQLLVQRLGRKLKSCFALPRVCFDLPLDIHELLTKMLRDKVLPVGLVPPLLEVGGST